MARFPAMTHSWHRWIPFLQAIVAVFLAAPAFDAAADEAAPKPAPATAAPPLQRESRPTAPRPERTGPINPRDCTFPLSQRLSTDPVTRAREIFFILRDYRVFSRDDEMAEAIRELHRIGKPAVPELIAELDRTERGSTLRVLGIAARALNDPRVVPALIRAVPRTLRGGESDCGVSISDPELLKFVHTLDRRTDSHMSVGRPVNEIHRAIEFLTKWVPPGGDRDPLRHVTLGDPLKEPQQRQQYLDRRQLLETWWAEHGEDYVPKEELAPLDRPADSPPPGELDPVARAGEARFGPLFPTGPDASLGPVHEVEVFSRHFADAPAALDLDQSHCLRPFEGGVPTDQWLSRWMFRTGADITIDADCDDLHEWVIKPERWETIDREVQSPSPLALGTESRGGFAYLKGEQTVLFTTREGGSGILQVSDYHPETGSKTVRYRMWKTPSRPDESSRKSAPKAASSPTESDEVWGAPVYVLLDPPGPKARCAWSIVNNQLETLPRDMSGNEIMGQLWSNRPDLPMPEIGRWKKDKEIGLLFYAVEHRGAPVPEPEEGAPPREKVTPDLVLLDARIRRVRSECFNRLPVGEARQFLDEHSDSRQQPVQSFQIGSFPSPATFVFQTGDGTLGIIQIQELSLKTGVKFRYRLVDSQSQEPPK